MLAELNLLLHEVGDSLRGRRQAHDPEPTPPPDADRQVEVLVTGVATAGKARLVAALVGRLAVDGIAVRATSADPPPPDERRLHVHAESDLDAMVEGRVGARHASRGAAVVVPVDWEPTARSVERIVEHLRSRGVTVTRGE